MSKYRTAFIATSLAFTCLAPLCVYAQDAPANAEIIKLVKAGLPEAVILRKISELQAKPGGVDSSTDALIALKDAGASDAVLNAMVPAPTNTPLPSVTNDPNSEPLKFLPRPIVFKNVEIEFTSLLVSTEAIRVNVAIRNTSEKPVYLWNNSEQDRNCQGVSLTDNMGNDFKCTGETLYAFSRYSEGNGGIAIEPRSVLTTQYVFDRTGIAPAKNFNFSAAPFLTIARPPQDVKMNAYLLRDLYNLETLGVSFTDLEAKVRPAAK
jgi:hypothetical protein